MGGKAEGLCRKPRVKHFPAVLFWGRVRAVALKTASPMYHIDYNERRTALDDTIIVFKP